MDEIRERVAERRRRGSIPKASKQELDAHFRRIVAHRRAADMADLRSSLEVLDVRARFSRGRIPPRPSVAGGARRPQGRQVS